MTRPSTPDPELDLERPAAPAADPAPTDRGVSPIAGPLGGRRGKAIILAAVAAGCGVFLAATWDRGSGAERASTTPDTPPRQLSPFEPARRDPPRLEDAAVDPNAPPLSEGETVPPPEVSGNPPPAREPTEADARGAMAESARRAPVMAYRHSGSAAPDLRAALAGDAGAAASPTTLDTLRQVSPIGRAAAGSIGDRNLLITAGSILPCVLQTALDSTTPGYVSCVVSRDIYSENGAVILLERGTRVLGEYRGGLRQGRRRLFVLWTRAVSPTGVAVGLASPASDALGRAGFDGQVDGHFWDRFGGALLLSLVDDAAYAGFGDGDSLRSTARVPSDAAASALQGSIDIPATLRKAQGSEVSIFVAQDLDFSGVYRLRARR
ncbi:type IV secretion system protein VirB10 [Brevundimonas naejangsanensis]|uniref:type IV secretion system protein VirB10 n=1 Tax=Brevundimonas naejangsanensis TaxID=588932 RepID=UPI0032091AE1